VSDVLIQGCAPAGVRVAIVSAATGEVVGGTWAGDTTTTVDAAVSLLRSRVRDVASLPTRDLDDAVSVGGPFLAWSDSERGTATPVTRALARWTSGADEWMTVERAMASIAEVLGADAWAWRSGLRPSLRSGGGGGPVPGGLGVIADRVHHVDTSTVSCIVNYAPDLAAPPSDLWCRDESVAAKVRETLERIVVSPDTAEIARSGGARGLLMLRAHERHDRARTTAVFAWRRPIELSALDVDLVRSAVIHVSRELFEDAGSTPYVAATGRVRGTRDVETISGVVWFRREPGTSAWSVDGDASMMGLEVGPVPAPPTELRVALGRIEAGDPSSLVVLEDRPFALRATRTADGTISAVAFDVTDLWYARAREARARLQLRAFVEAMPAVAFSLDHVERLIAYNRRFARWHREVFGVPPRRFAPLQFEKLGEASDRWKHRIQEAMSGERVSVDDTISTDDRVWRVTLEPIPHRGDETAICGFIEDISDHRRAELRRQRLERQVAEASREESVSMLAAGIAHDFNNLLAGILGNAEFLRDRLTEPMDVDTIADIRDAATVARDLVAQLSAYAGVGGEREETVDLGAVVSETVELARRVHRIEGLVETVEGETVLCIGDPSQVRQIVMNLVLNAWEARSERTPAIEVRTGTFYAQRDYLDDLRLGTECEPGVYAFIEVADNGLGMAPELASRVFDPFVTRHFVGRGLGLAAVLGIVRRHRGAIELISREGEGTLMRILLPVPGVGNEVRVESRRDGAGPAHGVVGLVGSRGSIQRSAVRRHLRQLNYIEHVMDAVDLVDHHELDAVFFLPDRMPGRAWLVELLASRPRTPLIILVDDEHVAAWQREASGLPARLMIDAIPLTSMQLQRTLRRAIGSQG